MPARLPLLAALPAPLPLEAVDPTPSATWVYVLIFAVGLLGIVVPILPGLLLCVAAVLIWAIDTGGTLAWATFAVALLVAAAGMALQLLLPGRRMKRQGVGTRTILLGLLAGIVGFFVVPVVGGPLFFVLGVYAVEYARYQEKQRAWAATRSALVGVLHSMGIELLTAMTIAVVWVSGVLAHQL